MSSTEEDDSMFLDLSVMIDYCLSYVPNQEETEYVLENFNGELATTKMARKEFNRQTTNRAELMKQLFRKITLLEDELENEPGNLSEEDKIDRICSEVLQQDVLQDIAPYELNASSDFEISALRKRLREGGIDDFKVELDTVSQRAKRKEGRLVNVLITNSHIEERDERMLETYIENTIGNRFRAKNLVQAVHWFNLGERPWVLVRHSDPAYQKRDEVNDSIESKYGPQQTIDIFSPVKMKKASAD